MPDLSKLDFDLMISSATHCEATYSNIFFACTAYFDLHSANQLDINNIHHMMLATTQHPEMNDLMAQLINIYNIRVKKNTPQFNNLVIHAYNHAIKNNLVTDTTFHLMFGWIERNKLFMLLFKVKEDYAQYRLKQLTKNQNDEIKNSISHHNKEKMISLYQAAIDPKKYSADQDTFEMVILAGINVFNDAKLACEVHNTAARRCILLSEFVLSSMVNFAKKTDLRTAHNIYGDCRSKLFYMPTINSRNQSTKTKTVAMATLQ